MKRKRISIAVLLAALFIFPGKGYCHHAAAGGSLGQACPIITVSATTLPKGDKYIGLYTAYTGFGAFDASELQEAAIEGNDIHNIKYLFTESIAAAYGVTEDLTLNLNLPYVLRAHIREGSVESGISGIENHGSSEGISDLAVLSEYRFFYDKNKGLEAAFLFGLKTPSGNTGIKDKTGARFTTEHQPGSGSWDPQAGIALTRHLRKFSFDTNYSYTFANKGAQDTYLGDIFNYNFSVSYCPQAEEESEAVEGSHHEENEHGDGPSWNYILEVNGEWRGKQKIGAEKDPNSGGNTIFFSPGIRLTTQSKWAYALSVGVPVFQNLDGKQNKSLVNIVFQLSKGF
ncbi:MAG: transporter [Candidatus Omnitrophica bacterium]|nr:transporter [Candidatus Omnitrophota bacterium]